MSDAIRPKVSVLVLTYNHERYIASALEAALAQNAAFEYEILIADDCSTDRTGEIVRRFATCHESKIRILPRPRNLGICRNFTNAYSSCTGEYVAVLEGDDVWHNPSKLTTLVEALDSRPDYSFAFHDVRLQFEDGREEKGCCPAHVRSTLRLRDFVVNNFVPNCSGLVFRNRLIDRFPDWFTSLSYYDWPLHVLHLLHGPALYLNEPLSTYRIHSGGAWHGAGTQYRLEKLLEIFDALNRHLNFEYDSIFRMNANYWRVQTENETLRRQHVAASSPPPVEAEERPDEREYQRVVNSRSYRLARQVADTKQWFARTLRFKAAA